ncbi:MAG: hypothetical protein V7711_08210 [Pseudomonadales bacterium]
MSDRKQKISPKMSMMEGESLFTGKGRRWEGDREAVRKTILKFIDEKYGEKS